MLRHAIQGYGHAKVYQVSRNEWRCEITVWAEDSVEVWLYDTKDEAESKATSWWIENVDKASA